MPTYFPARLVRLALIGGVWLIAATFAAGAAATATVNKQFIPATIDPGNASVLRISIFNTSLLPLTSAAVTDILPAQVAIANPANVVDGCGFTTVLATPATQRISLSGGTVPAGSGVLDGSCTFEIDVVSTTAGNHQNLIPALGPDHGFTPGGAIAGFSAVENGVPVTNTTEAIATLSVRALSNPGGSKTFAPSPAIVGEPATLSIVLSNPNLGTTIPLTSFTDNLPSGMLVATTPNAMIACTGTGAANGVITANAGSSSVTLSGGAIGAAGSCTLTVRIVVSSITGVSQSFNNTVALNAIGNTRGLGSAVFSRSLVVATPIGLAKSFVATVASSSALGSTPIIAGQEVFARIDISNVSTTTPLSVTSLTDNLPAGLVVGSGTPVIDCSVGGGTNGVIDATPGAASFSITGAVVGNTGATRRCRIHVPVVATAAGAYLNAIPANAVVNPGDYGSPAASATLNVNSELTVAKTVSSANAAPGQPVTFTLTIRNYSTGPVSGVALTDTLPAPAGQQMVLSDPVTRTASAGCTGGTWSDAPGSSSLSWSGGTIPGGTGITPGVCTITFRANAPAGAALGTIFTNSLATGSITGTGSGGPVANTGSTSVNVTMIAAASVAKAFSPTSIAQGGSSQLTVTVSNQTATALAEASLTDALPVGVVVAAVPTAATTCAGGTVAALAGATSATLSGATIPANGNCNFRFRVTASGVGTFTNTIPTGALANDQDATNPAPASSNLTVTSGLTATKSFLPGSVANGGISRVTVRVTNASASLLTGVTINDGPMTNLAVANPANASTTCAAAPVITAVPGSASVQLSGASILAGGSCDLLFDVVASGNPANWPNSLPIGAISSAEGPSNTAAVSATLSKITGISIGVNKSFNPVSVSGSQPSLLQIDLTNPVGSPSVVNGLAVIDNLPVGMEVHAVPNPSTTCMNGSVLAVPGTRVVQLTGATLAPAATCSVFVNVTSTRFLNLNNTIPAGAVSTTQGLTNSLGTTATLSTLQGLGVMKSFLPTSISTGQTARIDIRLVSTLNASGTPPVTLHGVSFSDLLPAGLTVATVPNASTDCVNGVVTAGAASGVVTLSSADIAPETDCHVFVDVVADGLGAYTNVIAANGVTSIEGYANATAASATLNVVNPPVISKTFTPVAVMPGEISRLALTIDNPNALALTSVGLTDPLPPGLALAPNPNAGTTCTGGAVAASPSGSTVALTNAALGANASCVIEVDVLSNNPGSYVNTIVAGALATTQGVSNVAPASATLNVLGPPSAAKAFVPPSVTTTVPSRLTIHLGNGNAAAITLSAPFGDTLPGGLVVASPGNLAGTCTPADTTASSGTSTISYAAGATIAPGGCTIEVDVVTASPGTFTNVIAAGALVTDVGSNPAPATAILTVTTPPSANLGVTKSNGVAGLLTATATVYSVSVANAGPDAADGAVIVDPAVPGLTKTSVVCSAAGGATCPLAPISVADLEAGLSIPTLPAGASVTFAIAADVTAPPGTQVTNAASVSPPPGTGDPDSADNTAADSDTVFGGTDLVIAKTHAGIFTRGQTGSFTLLVTNAGDVASTDTVSVIDALPAGLTVITLDGPGWSCIPAALTCTRVDALSPAASYPQITLVVAIDAAAASSLTNTATVSGGSDVNPGNNGAIDIVPITGAPDLSLLKSHTGTFLRGQPGSFTLLVSNVGTAPTGGPVTLVDSVPAGLIPTAIGGSGWTCTLAPLACSRSDPLAAGGAYPPVSIVFLVADNAGSPLVNSASVNTAGDSNPGNDASADAVSIGGMPQFGLVKRHVGTFTRGHDAAYELVVTNSGNTPTVGLVEIADTLPGGLSAIGIAGAGWTCVLATVSCSRSDALAPAASYPVITLAVAVAAQAPATLVNVATVHGGGTAQLPGVSATDTVVLDGQPDLVLGKVLAAPLVRGTAANYALTVRNVGSAPSAGPVTLTDELPLGLHAVSLTGEGWLCVIATLSCTRSDALAAGADFPAVTLQADVLHDAPDQITNRAGIAGGNDADPSNNAASAAAAILPGPGIMSIPTLSGWSLMLLALMLVVAARAGMRASMRRP